MNSQNKNRRRFLQASLAAVVTYTTNTLFSLDASVLLAAPIIVRLRDVMDVSSVILVAQKAISSVPENSAIDLTLVLQKSIHTASDGEKWTSVNCFQKYLASSIRDDFRFERTVKLDGWVVSLTEARLYALTSYAGGDHVLAVNRG